MTEMLDLKKGSLCVREVCPSKTSGSKRRSVNFLAVYQEYNLEALFQPGTQSVEQIDLNSAGFWGKEVTFMISVSAGATFIGYRSLWIRPDVVRW